MSNAFPVCSLSDAGRPAEPVALPCLETTLVKQLTQPGGVADLQASDTGTGMACLEQLAGLTIIGRRQ